tara:strand:+ start:130 stop:360 length:231 start_codon:yes stop_codon:yes gene_type:complete
MKKIIIILGTLLLSTSGYESTPEILCTSANYRITKTSGGTYIVKSNGVTRRYHSNALGLMPVQVIDALNNCNNENN